MGALYGNIKVIARLVSQREASWDFILVQALLTYLCML